MTVDRVSRGRPRAFDEDAALAAATRLFWDKGYQATSIGDLTEAMGIGSGSLYAAFGDKRSLFRSVVRRYGETPIGAFIGRALRDEPTAYRAFERILHEAAGQYADPAHPPGCLTISAATNITAQDAEVAEFLRDLRATNLTAFQLRLRRARRAGELPRSADPLALARYFAAVVQGMSQQARDGASPHELMTIADTALDAWPGGRPLSASG